MQMAREGQLYDTYPWPYCVPDFANWEEDDNSETYTLISDQALCVVKYPTSYCAWKIFETTGKWLERKERRRIDARDWDYLLAQNGFTETLSYKKPLSGHHYVGVNKSIDPWGEVVWLENVRSAHIDRVLVSTYEDKKYKLKYVLANDYIWVQID